MTIVAHPGVRSWPVALPPPGDVSRARANLQVLKVLDRLDADGGPPTPDDLADLARWSGWGPMAKAMDPRITEAPWGDLGEQVRHLLRPEDASEAEAAMSNAFYTPPHVTDAAWRALVDLGFDGGAVLEPGCGHGCFISAAPPHLDIRWTGVERDPVTARVAALLHPGARIVNSRLERVALPPSAWDAVVGNVPFANLSPYDPGAPFEMRLHNYFLWRALDALRPGGVAVLITSRFTMDALGGDDQRRFFADMAELLGAVRLPTGWEAEYGTHAVADMLVFRRRVGKHEARHAWWFEAAESEGSAVPHIALNEYFARHHPGLVLGQMHERPGARQGHALGVRFEGDRAALANALGTALDTVVASARMRGLAWAPPDAPADPVPGDLARAGFAEGRFELQGRRLVKMAAGAWEEVTGKDRGEITQLVRVRDAAVALMEAESDPDAPDADELRLALNTAVDTYHGRFGALNRGVTYVGKVDPETGAPRITRKRPSALATFRTDPDFARVMALEWWDEEAEAAAKAPVLLKRVSKRPARATRTDNPAEAVALCLDECGRLDADVVARLLGIDPAEVEGALGDLAYRDPETGGLVGADEYLSGNVRARLAAARRADEAAPGAWARNIAALEPVVPEDLGVDDIRAHLGSPWVPREVVQDFIEVTVKAPSVERERIARVSHQPRIALWAVEALPGQRKSDAATITWGTHRANAYELIQDALNASPTIVYDTVKVDGKDRQIRNNEETELADQKTRELQARFAEWLWADPARAGRLLRIYNDLYNSSVLRPFDGRHLTFPGLSPQIVPRRSQLDMVMRAMVTPATLCGHVVGAGKTGVIALTAMKLKSLGLVQKPVAVVPGHLLEQTVAEMLRWFPDAKVLMASSKDLAGYRRRLFAARCAAGDWDLVVMTHEAFKSLRVHHAVEADYLRGRIEVYRQAMLDGADPKDRTVKAISKAVETMRSRLEELLDRPGDPGVTFEELGIDFVFYDEAHYAKNLGVPCRTPGVSGGKASDRATDLHMKLWWLARRQRGRRHAMLLTGTPVSNSLAEMYVIQLYLQPDRLEELGVADINAWSANYVESETRVEVGTDGVSFRLTTRPSRFLNVADLRRTLAEVADIRTAAQLGLDLPALVTENVVSDATSVQARYIQGIVRRIDDIQDPDVYVDPKDDNMLKVCTDGRLCALHPSLVGEDDDEPGKVGALVAKVLELWRSHGAAEAGPAPASALAPPAAGQLDIFAWADRQEAERRRGGDDPPLQVVFCDVGTPKPGNPSVYGMVRAGLVAGGMDPARVRFVQEAKGDEGKAALFRDCRAGRVDVVMGSTNGLGVGTNIQKRLLAVHHLDAPWRPADVAQRLGRAQRPGNRYRTVYEFRYITEGTFDAYMWQMLERKLIFISQVLSGDLTAREVPDIGDIVLGFTEAKALATNNRYLIEIAEVDATIVKYGRLHRAHQRDIAWLEVRARRESEAAAQHDKRADRYQRVVEWRPLASSAGLAQKGSPRRVTDRTEAGTAAAAAMARVMKGKGGRELVGWYRGLTVYAVADRAHKGWALSLEVEASAGVEWALPVDRAWLGKGQVWRLIAAMDAFVDDAAPAAERERAEAARLREASKATLQEADRPFAYALELAIAEARRAEIEREMRREAKDREQQVQAA